MAHRRRMDCYATTTAPCGFQIMSLKLVWKPTKPPGNITRCISFPSQSSLLRRHSFRPVSCLEASVQEKVLDGKAVAEQIRKELKEKVDSLYNQYAVRPGLAVILVGDRKDSQTYVRNKHRFAKEVGLESFTHHLPESVPEAHLLEVRILLLARRAML